jgi:hypothetical protein
MTWWLAIVGYLYVIVLLMKSQEKITPKRLQLLKKNLVQYTLKYRERVTWKNSIFWRVHISLCCFVNFCDKTGMEERALAEGFENKHYLMGISINSSANPAVPSTVRDKKQK